MYHILLIHSFVDGHMGYFCLLVVVNYTVMNTGVQMSVGPCGFSCLEYKPRSGMAGSQVVILFLTF